MSKKTPYYLLLSLAALPLLGASAQAQVGISAYEFSSVGVDYLDAPNGISLQGTLGQTFASSDPSTNSPAPNPDMFYGFGETAVKYRYAGTIAFQGWVGSGAAIPLEVSFWTTSGNVFSNSTTALTQANVGTPANGDFTADSWINPSYVASMRVKGPIWLRQANTITIPADPTQPAGANFALLAGDANGDNVVSLEDFNLLADTFGLASSDPGYDVRVDFNGDGVVSLEDFNLLADNYGNSGDDL